MTQQKTAVTHKKRTAESGKRRNIASDRQRAAWKKHAETILGEQLTPQDTHQFGIVFNRLSVEEKFAFLSDENFINQAADTDNPDTLLLLMLGSEPPILKGEGDMFSLSDAFREAAAISSQTRPKLKPISVVSEKISGTEPDNTNVQSSHTSNIEPPTAEKPEEEIVSSVTDTAETIEADTDAINQTENEKPEPQTVTEKPLRAKKIQPINKPGIKPEDELKDATEAFETAPDEVRSSSLEVPATDPEPNEDDTSPALVALDEELIPALTHFEEPVLKPMFDNAFTTEQADDEGPLTDNLMEESPDEEFRADRGVAKMLASSETLGMPVTRFADEETQKKSQEKKDLEEMEERLTALEARLERIAEETVGRTPAYRTRLEERLRLEIDELQADIKHMLQPQLKGYDGYYETIIPKDAEEEKRDKRVTKMLIGAVAALFGVVIIAIVIIQALRRIGII